MSRDESNPEPFKAQNRKLGIVIVLTIGLSFLYIASEYLLLEEEESVCDPELDDCSTCHYSDGCRILGEVDFNIIVRFIGINQQLLTNTNPFYYR